MRYRLVIDKLQVTRGGDKKTYRRGDFLDDVRPSMLEQIVRVKQAVPEDEFTEPPEELKLEPTDPTREVPPESDVNWQLAAITDLEISEQIKAALATAGMTTVADILAFGEGHGTLTKLDGIGAASEKAVQAAIEKIAPTTE